MSTPERHTYFRSVEGEEAAAWGPRLQEAIHSVCRVRHLSRRTEKAYVSWMRRFLRAHRFSRPETLGATEVTEFLSDLAVHRQVAAPTQNQALAALLFFYRDVLGIELPQLDQIVRAKRPARLPVVLSREDVGALLEAIDGPCELVGRMLYGAGLRILEALRLGSRTWISIVTRSPFVRARETAIGSPCCRRRSSRDCAQMRRVSRLHERDLLQGAD